MIHRMIQKKVKKDFFSGKVILLLGARQVGKTSFAEHLLKTYKQEVILSLNGEDPADREKLDNQNLANLKKLVGKHRIIFIDEAQKIPSIGQTAKLLVDHYKKKKQLILTGSSSFNILTQTNEPLTGRNFIHELFPLSAEEIIQEKGQLTFEKELENVLIYGSYPEIYLAGNTEKERLLTLLSSSYLFRDIFELQNIRNPAMLSRLLSALALQVGSEVSLSELSSLLGIDLKTVERYIDLMEKSYLIFRLPPFYDKKRKSISKRNKIYFYDLGVRNAMINNFNPLTQRNDVGALWENFIMVERMKFRRYREINANAYFWRSYDGAEIDLIEERGGKLKGYEIKWGKKRTNPKSWLDYKGASYRTIDQGNYLDFIR